jgi:hypothetical protein
VGAVNSKRRRGGSLRVRREGGSTTRSYWQHEVTSSNVWDRATMAYSHARVQ